MEGPAVSIHEDDQTTDDIHLGVCITQLYGNITLEFVFESNGLHTTDRLYDLEEKRRGKIVNMSGGSEVCS